MQPAAPPRATRCAPAQERPSVPPAGDRPDPPTPRGRRRLFAGVVVACAAGCTIAIAIAANVGEPDTTAPSSARQLLPAARAADRPLVIFRATGDGPAATGQIVIGDLRRPGDQTAAPLRCDRVHFAAGRGLCVTRGRDFAAGYRATIFGADLRASQGVGLAGIPSRARVSPDGRLGAVTQFVTGHSYAESGSFSTSTTLIDLASGTKIADLESFSVLRGERFVTAEDVNFWGVTFARDSDRFYATLATGGQTYLVRGSVSARRMRVIHENVECPSLSPDGSRLAYKKRVGSGSNPWRLSVIELDTMRETPLAETRSVDDQVEWVDGDNVLYGHGDSVWTVRSDGADRPRRFLAGASSPAIVRW